MYVRDLFKILTEWKESRLKAWEVQKIYNKGVEMEINLTYINRFLLRLYWVYN